jgi:signal recognition particle subunit SEC65
MKCIKNQTTGEIRRVADEVAYSLETKGWGYIPKSEWKDATRVKTSPTEKVVSEVGKPRRNREKKNKR